MASEISANGLKIVLSAVPTFPMMVLSHFPDDTDPLDIPNIDIAEGAMSMSGDLVSWSTPKMVEVSIGVIPNSNEDFNLNVLFSANAASKNKISSKDLITMTAFYTDGTTKTISGGRCKGMPPGTSAASSGRKKSKTYTFMFESIVQVIPPSLPSL